MVDDVVGREPHGHPAEAQQRPIALLVGLLQARAVVVPTVHLEGDPPLDVGEVEDGQDVPGRAVAHRVPRRQGDRRRDHETAEARRQHRLPRPVEVREHLADQLSAGLVVGDAQRTVDLLDRGGLALQPGGECTLQLLRGSRAPRGPPTSAPAWSAATRSASGGSPSHVGCAPR